MLPSRFSGDNLSGIKKLYLAKAKDITTPLTPLLVTGGLFKPIYYTQDTATWTHRSVLSQHNSFVQHTIELMHPKYSQAAQDFIAEWLDIEILAYVILHNGNGVFVGSKHYPLKLSQEFGSATFESRQQYVFRLFGSEQLNRLATNIPPVVTEPAPTPPIGDAFANIFWQTPKLPQGEIDLPVGSCRGAAFLQTSISLTDFALSNDSLYEVKVRVRGKVELVPYQGGTQQPNTEFYTGGELYPLAEGWNIYQLEVSNPAQTYYINAASNIIYGIKLIDYVATIQLRGNATLTMTMQNPDEIQLYDPLGVVTDDDTVRPIRVPQPYAGQFAQVDVLSVKEI